MILKIFLTVIIFCASIFNFGVAECREIFFVVNAGQNMKVSDPFHVVPESIIWSAQNFSAADEIGVITFNEMPQVLRPLSNIKDNPIDNLQIEYSGQSNASAALLQAVDILSKKFETDRAIIFFTDGENLLDENSQNATFVENIKAGLRQAKWLGIPVYILSLRADINPQNYHSYDWAKEIPLNYLDLMTAVRTIMHNDFQTPHLNILEENTAEKNLTFEVPITAPDRLKILLLSSSAGNADILNFENVPSVKRNFVKIFELNAPQKNKFEIRADFPQGNGLTLDVIPQVSGILQTNISMQIFSANILEITPLYTKNPEVKIFGDKYFEGKSVNLQINDKNFVGAVEDGVIKVSLDGVGETVNLQKIHFENLGVVFSGNDTAQLKNPTNIFVWIIALAAILTILILSRRLQKDKSRSDFFIKKFWSPKKIPIIQKNFSYHGKLIISASNVEEIAPREFNLFRVTDAQISLSKILEGCNLKNFPDAEGVLIKPTERGILLENNSACTITKQNELIEQGRNIELFYNDSVNISADAAEMILIFESLKPN